ncbi:MAG TPA: hypothetical protein VJ725_08250, partial [Thermoanaerobaculia bacterium]|nr:hypothetical protein [Thermoanaerobaculia bacterium]
ARRAWSQWITGISGLRFAFEGRIHELRLDGLPGDIDVVLREGGFPESAVERPRYIYADGRIDAAPGDAPRGVSTLGDRRR